MVDETGQRRISSESGLLITRPGSSRRHGAGSLSIGVLTRPFDMPAGMGGQASETIGGHIVVPYHDGLCPTGEGHQLTADHGRHQSRFVICRIDRSAPDRAIPIDFHLEEPARPSERPGSNNGRGCRCEAGDAQSRRRIKQKSSKENGRQEPTEREGAEQPSPLRARLI